MDADVVVIGAGAAGLAAARALASRSIRVILIEGRDRIGGRVVSSPSGRPSVPAELGAEFIHGPAGETIALLREAGTTAIESTGESWSGTNGNLQRIERDFVSAAGIFEGTRALANDESVERFLQRFDGDEAVRDTVSMARAFVEGFDAGDPAVASASAIADEWRSGVDSVSARPLGGYDPMFTLLDRACTQAGVRTYLLTTTRRISWRRGSVMVETRNRLGESQTFRARAAIVTVPVGVLRHRGDETALTFDPELPLRKREALASIEMGHVVKVVLRFRTAFWERLRDRRYRDGAFFQNEDDAQRFTTFWTQFPVRSELVVAWLGGPKAIALADASESEIIEHALHGFETIFGEQTLAREEFEGAVMHDWSRDPFARGAYSYVATGIRNPRTILGAPIENTLFFAGEATSIDGQGGTVNGALETGARAASEVVSSFVGAA